MKQICKRIFHNLLIFLLVLSVAVPAHAAGSGFDLAMNVAIPVRAASSFVDVPYDLCPWYADVTYLADHAIVTGNSGDSFSPYAPVTARQWAVMLCRAFREPMDDDACLTEARRAGWLSPELSAETGMPRGVLYQSAFRAAGLPVDGTTDALSARIGAVRAAKELGLCPEDAPAMDIVSRGEAAALLHDLLTWDFQPGEIPSDPLAGISIENGMGVELDEYLRELRRVPTPILREFQRQGWGFIIDCDYLHQMSQERETLYVGATDYQARQIYVCISGAILHEFGHFLDSVLGFPSKDLYDAEAGAAAVFLRDYAITSRFEYFADYFAYWLEYHDVEEKAAQMKRLTPETFDYFTRLSETGWVWVK